MPKIEPVKGTVVVGAAVGAPALLIPPDESPVFAVVGTVLAPVDIAATVTRVRRRGLAGRWDGRKAGAGLGDGLSGLVRGAGKMRRSGLN